MLPIMVVLSIIWTAWDPTYASLRRAQIQGREMRQRGKREYNVSVSSIAKVDGSSILHCVDVTNISLGLPASSSDVYHLAVTSAILGLLAYVT